VVPSAPRQSDGAGKTGRQIAPAQSSGLYEVFNAYPIARVENSPGEFLTMTPPRRSKLHPFRAAQTKNSNEFRLLAKNIDFCHDREYRARTVD